MFTKLLKFLRQVPRASVCELSEVKDDVDSSLDDELKSQCDPEETSGDVVDDDNEDHPRCDWKTIDAIPDSRYEELVSQVCTFSDPPELTKKIRYEKGTFNAASFVAVTTCGVVVTYIVRVPGHATKEHWTRYDAYMMKREAQILEHIGRNTSAQVPRLCTYSTTFNNALGHPFIMMTRLEGESACNIWFDDEYDEDDPKINFRFGDLPLPAVEKKRINFLRSLAQAMAEISTISFHEIGMPIVPVDGSAPPSIGPMYQWDFTADDGCIERPVFTSTQDYVRTRPYSLRMSEALDSNSKTQNYILGARTLLDMVFAQPVFNPSPSISETFTLRHCDLDLQNILVDEEGNVTGIIDWDKCLSVPRCVGAATAPFFLQKDWMPAYLNNLETSPHMTFTTHRYRQIYAAALAEYGCADAKYTSKSAMYQAAVMSLYEYDCGDVDDFLEKVLRCIPEFRGDVKETIRAFGVGWPAGERLLERHLKQIFEPEMPDSNVLAEVDAAVAAMDWMIGFKYATEYETEVDLGETFFAAIHSYCL
jgi:hypothetical protein